MLPYYVHTSRYLSKIKEYEVFGEGFVRKNFRSILALVRDEIS